MNVVIIKSLALAMGLMPLGLMATQDANFVELSYAEIERYLAESSSHLIGPSLQREFIREDGKKVAREDLRFRMNKKRKHFEALGLSADAAQKLFVYDVDGFIRGQNAADFSSAKKSYFQNRHFNKKEQSYSREYSHLFDWKSLPHPPIRDVSELSKFHPLPKTSIKDSSLLSVEFNMEMDQLTGSELTSGNTTKLLVNNNAYFEKLRLIEEAKTSILAAVMVIAQDQTSMRLLEALIQRANAGVDVTLMLDKVLMKALFKKTLRKIKGSKVKLILVDDFIKFKKSQRLIFHNKIWIFDSNSAIVGGQNILNSSNSSTGFNHWNKDSDIALSGPVVTDVLREYLHLLDRYYPEHLQLHHYKTLLKRRLEDERQSGKRGNTHYSSWLQESSALKGNCRFVIQGPQRDRFALSKAYERYFRQAQKYIILTSQHIEYKNSSGGNPPWAAKIFKTLYQKGEEGVKIDLIANGIDGGFAEMGQNIVDGDRSPRRQARLDRRFERQLQRDKEPSTLLSRLSEDLSRWSTKSYAPYLDEASRVKNMSVWMHFQYIHSKTVLVDDVMASVGSFNFEPWSAERSHESAVFCFDENLIKELKADNIRDIVNSTPVFPGTMVK